MLMQMKSKFNLGSYKDEPVNALKQVIGYSISDKEFKMSSDSFEK